MHKVAGVLLFWPFYIFLTQGLIEAQNRFLTFPLPDSATSVYNGWLYWNLKKHRGIDYRASIDTDVIAAADGLAISSCQPPLIKTDPNTDDTYGNFVLIDHQNGFTTLYAHLNSISLPAESQLPCDDSSRRAITRGDIQYGSSIFQWKTVRRGEPIGKVGKTGTTYYHLHFEVARNQSGDYSTHILNKVDSYAIYQIFQFYPPPTSKCSNSNPLEFLWTACPPLGPMDDDFNDNSLNPNLWFSNVQPPGIGTITETNQQLEMRKTSSGASYMGLATKCQLSGDFDVQVDFKLLTWPAANFHGVRLGAVDLPEQFGKVGVYRVSYNSENYEFRTQNNIVSISTSDTSGTMRVTRTRTTVSGYYHNGTDFALIGSALTTTNATGFVIDFSNPLSNAIGGVAIAFDNFIVNPGPVVCPP
jgi:hypothetical protein